MSGESKNIWHRRAPRSCGARPTHRIRRGVVQLGVLLLVTLGLVAGIGGAASAHTNSISATCEKLSVKLTSYAGSGNRVQVTIDGTSRPTPTFGASYTQTFTFADSTMAHTWTVKVTAVGRPGRQQGLVVHPERDVHAVRTSGRVPVPGRHPAARHQLHAARQGQGVPRRARHP